MKRRHWFIATIVAFIAVWFMPLPAYILYPVVALLFIAMLLMMNKAITLDDDYESYKADEKLQMKIFEARLTKHSNYDTNTPANIDEVNNTRPEIVPMKHDDDIDWEGVGL